MDNLNQEEIDALVQSFLDEGQQAASAQKTIVLSEETGERGRKRYRAYDFRRPEKISKDHLRNLRTQLSIFGRKAANHLARLARTSVDLPLVEIDQLPYDEVFTSHTVPPVTCVFRPGIESSQGIFKINLNQVFSVIDRLMGGSGESKMNPRPLTEFEESLIRAEVFEKLLAMFAEAFGSPYSGYPIQLIETDERLIPRSLPTEAVMLRAIFNLRFGNTSGHLNLYLPLDTVLPLLQGSARVSPHRQAGIKVTHLPGALARLHLTVSVELGHAWMPARAVADLKPGDLLPLERNQDTPLDVRIGGVVRFSGRPGVRGARLAVELLARKPGDPVEEDA